MMRLREARDKAGWTLRELADRSGLALSTLWQIESGRQPNPQLASVMKIARTLGVDTHEIEEFQSVLAEMEKDEQPAQRHAEPRERPQEPARPLPEELGGVVEQEIASIAGDEIFQVNVLLKPALVQRGAEQALDKLMDYLGKEAVDRVYERKFGARFNDSTDRGQRSNSWE